ncbi:hypothetical protein [Marinobacter sp. MBR-105]|jgi:hypothetical protein
MMTTASRQLDLLVPLNTPRIKVAQPRTSEPHHIRKKALLLWESQLSHFISCSDLAEHVAATLQIDSSILLVWQTLYDWPTPKQDNLNRTSSLPVDDEYDPCDHADDPLERFYDELRQTGYRRYISNYIRNAGYLSPGETDLGLVQRLLDRHPVSLDAVGQILCQESPYFAKYARAKGIQEPAHSKLNHPINQLVLRDPHLATVAVRHAQRLYRERLVPIRVIAQRMNLEWTDLWLLGVRYGCWELPEPRRMDELYTLIVQKRV